MFWYCNEKVEIDSLSTIISTTIALSELKCEIH